MPWSRECAAGGRRAAVGGRGDQRNLEAVLARELVVALILAGRAHDRAGAVAHQDVVGDPDRNVLAVEQVARVCAGEDAGLFLDRREPFDLALAPRLRDVLLDCGALLGRGDFGDQRMLRREHHERHAEDRVGAGGEEADLLARMAVHGKGEFRALGASDPVALHQLDRLGPIDPLEVVEQAVGVGGDLEEPLLEVLLGDRRVGVPPAASVDHLLVGQDGAALLAPPLRADGAVGESALEHQQEEPLRPAVVLGGGGIDFARPVVGASDQLQLSLEVSGVARNGLLGMQPLEQGVVLGRQAEGVPAHRVQHVVTGHPLVAADHVAGNVVVQMADGEAVARRIGEHLEHVELWPFAILAREVEVGAVPFGLPVRLDFPGLVAFVHRHSISSLRRFNFSARPRWLKPMRGARLAGRRGGRERQIGCVRTILVNKGSCHERAGARQWAYRQVSERARPR